MDRIIDAITEWLKEFFIGAIQTNLSTMFNDVNTKVGTIAGEVGQTPQGWNSSIFNMIKNLSDNVILPIAGIIITYVLCYELIHMVMEKNHGNDMEFWEFFVYFVKMWIAVWMGSYTEFNLYFPVKFCHWLFPHGVKKGVWGQRHQG